MRLLLRAIVSPSVRETPTTVALSLLPIQVSFKRTGVAGIFVPNIITACGAYIPFRAELPCQIQSPLRSLISAAAAGPFRRSHFIDNGAGGFAGAATGAVVVCVAGGETGGFAGSYNS